MAGTSHTLQPTHLPTSCTPTSCTPGLHLDVGLHLNLGQGQSCLRRLGRRWATTEFGRRGPQQCPQRLHRMDSMGIFAPPKQKCRKEIRVERTLLVGPFGESQHIWRQTMVFLSFLKQQIPKASQLFGMTFVGEKYKLRPRWTYKTHQFQVAKVQFFFQGHTGIQLLSKKIHGNPTLLGGGRSRFVQDFMPKSQGSRL